MADFPSTQSHSLCKLMPSVKPAEAYAVSSFVKVTLLLSFSYGRDIPPLRHRLRVLSVLVLHEKLSLTQIKAQCTGHMLRIWKLL